MWNDYSIKSSAPQATQAGRLARELDVLEIDDKSELGGFLDWQISWLLALKNTRDIGTYLAVQVGVVRPIADQCALFLFAANRISSQVPGLVGN